MNDFVISVIRTNVPYVISAVASYLATRGIDVSEEAKAGLAAFLTWLIGSIYYIVARHLEKRNPSAGKLLGVAKAPEYK